MRYTVKWGTDTKVFDAASEQDAWAKFCQGNKLASVHPRLYEREVTEGVTESVEEVAEPAFDDT